MSQNDVMMQVESRLKQKDSLPEFEIGDTVDVHVRIVEGEKSRIQIFTGTVIARKHGGGKAACFTFPIGEHYVQWAHQGHAALLLGAIDNLLKLDRRALVTAPPLVEINQRAHRNGDFEWISLYNHTGQRGKALHMPVPISGVRVDFKPRKPVTAVRLLRAGQQLTPTKRDDGRITVVLPPLDHYEMVVFEYQDDRT